MSSTLHLTTQEYGRMVERGAFNDLNRKIELIRGAIVETSPAGSIHDNYAFLNVSELFTENHA